jgi:adenylate cyclase
VGFASFQTRVVVFFAGLLVLALAASFLAVNQASIANARRVISADLAEDAAVFRRLFAERTRHLLDAARLLSSDHAFKTAYATTDPRTILSAMDNHLGRIAGANVMLLVSLDGEVIADTGAPRAARRRANPWPWLVAAAEEDDYGEAAGLVTDGDRLYQMMVVPLLVPDLDAWIFIGFLIDPAYAADLRQLIGSQVSILRARPAAWRAVATTLPAELAAELPALLAARRLVPGETATVRLRGEAHVSAAIELAAPSAGGPGDGAGEGQVLVLLQRPLGAELAPFMRLRLTLLLLFAASLALSVGAATAIARSVTRPVLDLAARARRIEQGDYRRGAELERRDEIGTLAHSFNLMVDGLAEKERVRDLLGKVVSPEIAEELLSKEIELGGEERVVTVLFSDVRNFTNLCEGRPPQEILALLNVYLTRVSGVIERHGGVVDKYIGDAVMALFGAPLAHGDDAARAVSAGLAMVECLAELNHEWRDRGWPALGIGVGINTDLVVVGNMGSATRLNYTVIGDGVNLASRLEGLTKRYGATLLVSEATRRGAPGFVYRELDRVRVKGKNEAVAIHEPLGPAGGLAAQELEDLERFHRALDELRAGAFAAAERGFAALAERAPDERHRRLYRLYEERARGYLETPPEPGWDGTVDYQQK